MPFTILTQMTDWFRAFRNDEDGAATADFVVLTASVVALGLAHVKDVADGTLMFAESIDECLVNDMTAVLDGDPANFVANLEAAAQGCSSR